MSAIKKIFGTKKVYFPNLIFTIVRDSKIGSNQAAFKVPLHVNKFDIKDYLTNIYKVNVTDVRTVVLPGRPTVDIRTGLRILTKRTKKAIVTLSEEFKYPDPPNFEDFGQLENRYSMIRNKNRLKGWRFRMTKEESAFAKKVVLKSQNEQK
ncbi:hypothetical protein BB559_000992 [Furculomyces boomerangus]|uniref:Large ribosomal subunit protein uL23m n=2 Tax=Harpellales TaxID=61421 RepID=A0A2T9Z3F8_9FUNG|nr:hypothetical protein BB559_004507 [Furculomyces boomerangus]PVU99130.1 hypothetical protein BB559_000992 [Furculomyces boomerangus]PWA02945.1 hypothetical protein BB558_000903 [Smittium angustum]